MCVVFIVFTFDIFKPLGRSTSYAGFMLDIALLLVHDLWFFLILLYLTLHFFFAVQGVFNWYQKMEMRNILCKSSTGQSQDLCSFHWCWLLNNRPSTAVFLVNPPIILLPCLLMGYPLEYIKSRVVITLAVNLLIFMIVVFLLVSPLSYSSFLNWLIQTPFQLTIAMNIFCIDEITNENISGFHRFAAITEFADTVFFWIYPISLYQGKNSVDPWGDFGFILVRFFFEISF